MNSIVTIGSGCLVCLMPLALYLLYLSYLHQRSHPTKLSGPWDFASVLLGLSGFLLIGGIVLLTVIDSTWRHALFSGSYARLRLAWNTAPRIWSFLAATYYVTLIAVLVGAMQVRRRVSIVYHLDRFLAEEVIRNVLETLQLAWRKLPDGFEIADRKGEHGELLGATRAKLRILPFSSLHLVTLQWEAFPRSLRETIDQQIDQALESVESPESTVGGWFLTIAVAIFLVMLLWMIFLIYLALSAWRAAA